MSRNYERIKQRVGINITEKKNGLGMNLDEAFKRLRPNSPYKLSEMISPRFNPRKNEKEFKLIVGGESVLRKYSVEQIKEHYMYKNINNSSVMILRKSVIQPEVAGSYKGNTKSYRSSHLKRSVFTSGR